jgi:putative transposase
MYFVTVCAANRAAVFGHISKTSMELSPLGTTAQDCWRAIPYHFSNIILDSYVVMPNHIHGVLHLLPSPMQENQSGVALSIIINQYKSAVTRCSIKQRGKAGSGLWQRGYYEHVVRDEKDLDRIREYITTNPLRWMLDRENPQRTGADEFDTWLEREYGKRPGSSG